MSEKTYTATEVAAMARKAGAVGLAPNHVIAMLEDYPEFWQGKRITQQGAAYYVQTRVWTDMLHERHEHAEKMAKLRDSFERYGKEAGERTIPEYWLDEFNAYIKRLEPESTP